MNDVWFDNQIYVLYIVEIQELLNFPGYPIMEQIEPKRQMRWKFPSIFLCKSLALHKRWNFPVAFFSPLSFLRVVCNFGQMPLAISTNAFYRHWQLCWISTNTIINLDKYNYQFGQILTPRIRDSYYSSSCVTEKNKRANTLSNG